MDDKTKETLLIVGVAAALGLVAGAVAYQDHKPDRGKLRDMGSRHSLGHFLERMMDALPAREAEHMIERGRDKIKDYSSRATLSDFLERVVDALPRREAEHLLHRIQDKLKKYQ